MPKILVAYIVTVALFSLAEVIGKRIARSFNNNVRGAKRQSGVRDGGYG